MVFVGAFILPHGAVTFDGNPESSSAECRERYNAMDDEMKEKTSRLYKGVKEAAEAVAETKPDIVILHSPHGLCLSQSVLIHVNETAQGTAEWRNNYSEFEVTVPMCEKTSDSMIGHFIHNGIPVEPMKSFSGFRPTPLAWGEAIPLWFLSEAFKSKDNSEVKYVLLTSPRPKKPLENLNEMHMKLGSSLAKFISAQKRRIAVVISGDLSHTHPFESDVDCYNRLTRSQLKSNKEKAEELDTNIKSWILSTQEMKVKSTVVKPANNNADDGATERNGDEEPESKKAKVEEMAVIQKWIAGKARPFLQKACKANPMALACGISGITILHSTLSLFFFNMPLIPHVYTYEVPTYFSMMAASFIPYNEEKSG